LPCVDRNHAWHCHSIDRGVNLVSSTIARERAAAICKAVRAIKRGNFASYGEVARHAGLPGRARLVGQVLRESGDDARLPWHRVTAAGGRIAFPPGSSNAREQLARLAREGVRSRGNRVFRNERDTARSLDALLWKM
jgi:methylated-DNA-protein-cysteine methyltransferase-like protein